MSTALRNRTAAAHVRSHTEDVTAVRTAIIRRGLVPGVGHRTRVRSGSQWVLMTASGMSVAGQRTPTGVVLERIDQDGNGLGRL